MFLAPFSEAPPIGRMPVYILTHLVFIGLQFPVIYARNIGTLLTFRFLSGFIGSPVLATGAASLADLFTPKKLPYAVAIWVSKEPAPTRHGHRITADILFSSSI